MADAEFEGESREAMGARVTAPPRPFDAEEAPASEPAAVEQDAPGASSPESDLPEAAAPEPAAAFDDLAELPALIEALLFVADHPVEVSYLARALEVTELRVERALDVLAETLRAGRGIRLQRGPQGLQLVSAPEAAERIEYFLGLEANRRLSTAALETLAIVAYRQPVTRGQIDAIRGVSSDGALATLRARDLVEPAGHAPGPGRPMLFRTTQRFLEHFGLERPGQLPSLPADIDLPPHEIGEQLGLEEAEVVAALREEAEPTAEEAEAAARVDLPENVEALSEAVQSFVRFPEDGEPR